MPTLHLICGFTGSGKTTFAKKLERDIPAVRFSPDEWMVRLYGHNPPAELFRGYYDRVMELIWHIVLRLLNLGQDVILDFGFWSRPSRDAARETAAAAGVRYQLYFLECSEEIMRRRVLKRTEELPADALWIDEAAFDLFKSRFEPLDDDEEHIRIDGTENERSTLPEYVSRNRSYWNTLAREYEEPGARSWKSNEPTWGIWNIPESELRVLPDVAGKDVIELGCGTAYISAWLARRGAMVVGIDSSPVQLANAQRFQQGFGLKFPLIQAAAEAVPLPDRSFDLAVSEYGASIWSDPYLWIPEVARILRPGGELIFLVNSTILMLCIPDEEDQPTGERLLRPYFGMHRFDWPDGTSVEFHLGHGDWIRLLRCYGFEVEDLIEIRAPEGAQTRHPYVTGAWARKWPAEEIWKARRREM